MKMTDKQFSALLKKLSKANSRYKRLLREAENEIERRFGVHPSDVDNDQWIDVYHVGTGGMTVEQVNDSMEFSIGHKNSIS